MINLSSIRLKSNSVYCSVKGILPLMRDYNAKIGQVEEALKKGDLFVVVDDVTYTAVKMPDPAAPEPGCDSGEMDHNGRCGKFIDLFSESFSKLKSFGRIII